MSARDITIRFADDELRRMENMMGALGKDKARQGLARAVNRVTRTVHGRVIRAIAKQSSIPTKIVRASVRYDLAAHKGIGPIQGIVRAKGTDLPLKLFNPRQFSWGVRVKLYGKTTRLPGSFIWAGTWKSGKAAFNGHVATRKGKDSFPITIEKGPAVPGVMISNAVVKIYEDTVQTMLPQRAMHELTRLLNA